MDTLELERNKNDEEMKKTKRKAIVFGILYEMLVAWVLLSFEIEEAIYTGLVILLPMLMVFIVITSDKKIPSIVGMNERENEVRKIRRDNKRLRDVRDAMNMMFGFAIFMTVMMFCDNDVEIVKIWLVIVLVFSLAATIASIKNK